MAVSSAGFKQQCPTCETMVLIKDPRQVGKKMECPKCKDRFLVEEPVEEAQEVEQANGNGKAKEGTKVDRKTKSNGKASPQAKAPAKRFRDEDEEADEAPAKSKGKGKARDDDEDDAPAKKKKKEGGSNKMLPIILAGVGLVVLIVAAVLIMTMSRSGTPTASGPPAGGANPNPNAGNPGNTNSDTNNEEKKDVPAKKTGEQQPVPARGLGMAAGPEITNLLPNDTEHVLHVNLKDLFDSAHPYREAIFGAGSFQDSDLKSKLGFSLLAIDALIRAEKYTAASWNYTVIHSMEPFDQKALTQAFGLKAAAPINNQTYFQATRLNPYFEEFSRLSLGISANQRNLGKQDRTLWIRVHNPQTIIVGDEAPIMALLKANSQFKLLTDIAPTLPAGQPGGATPMGNPMGNPMNMNPMNMNPMNPMPMNPMKYGGAGTSLGSPGAGNSAGEGGFGEPEQGAQVANTILAPPLGGGGGGQSPMPMGPMPMGPMPMGPMPMGGAQPMPNQGSGLARSETWLTIEPNLKAILDRLQFKAADSKDIGLFASATDMTSARIDTSRIPELKDQVLWHPRQLWDVTQLLQERRPRIKALGTALVQRDSRIFQYRTELICGQEGDAKDLRKDVVEKAAPHIARAIDRLLLGHDVEIPKLEAPMLLPPGSDGLPGSTIPYTQPMPMGYDTANPYGQPMVKKEELPKASKLNVAAKGPIVEMMLDLVFDPPGYARLNNLLGLVAGTVKAEVDLAGGLFSRHDLGTAGKLLGERGLSERGVGPGRYPPAAFKRAGATRAGQQPGQRISWLAGMLPFLSQDTLYQRLEFDASWQDPKNWLAARTLVPQFLDPQYPDSARFTLAPEVGIEMAATHVVGIAGIGLDAADYGRDDPAFAAKRGVFGYDGSASLDEIRKGRGVSNTAMMIQIPHDGPTGVTPWIAGGGATLRGVPEKNSIAPFVLSTDKSGKPIQHGGKRGTYVVMADGSVRFVSAGVSDAVFQAMCTVQGSAPDDFDLNKNPDTPLVPRQQAAKADTKIDTKAATVTPKETKVEAPAKTQAATSRPRPMTADEKAFHEGVQQAVKDFQAADLAFKTSLPMAIKNPAQLETVFTELQTKKGQVIQNGRQLKAPASKEGQDYHAAFQQFIGSQEKMVQNELRQMVDAIKMPTADTQARLLKIGQQLQEREGQEFSRLQNAQLTFMSVALPIPAGKQ